MSSNLDIVAALGPLLGTLTPEGFRTSLESMEDIQQQRLNEQAQAAAQAAQAAQGQYQQAAGAPPPSVGGAAFVPQLFGNIASVLAQNPAFSQRAQQNIQTQQGDLMQARRDNLMSLQNIYQQKAQAAEKMGNLEVAEKMRTSHERVNRTLKQMQDDQDFKQALALEKERQAGREKETAAEHINRLGEIAETGRQNRLALADKSTNDPKQKAALVRQGVDPETGFTLRPFAQREMTRRLALAKRGDSKSRDEALNGMLDIAVSRWSTDKTPLDMVMRLKRLQHPFYGGTRKDARYAVTGEKIYRKVGKEFIEDREAAARAQEAIREIVTPWFEGE